MMFVLIMIDFLVININVFGLLNVKGMFMNVEGVVILWFKGGIFLMN